MSDNPITGHKQTDFTRIKHNTLVPAMHGPGWADEDALTKKQLHALPQSSSANDLGTKPGRSATNGAYNEPTAVVCVV